MSDESPKLRLKPRLVPEPMTPISPADPPSPAVSRPTVPSSTPASRSIVGVVSDQTPVAPALPPLRPAPASAPTAEVEFAAANMPKLAVKPPPPPSAEPAPVAVAAAAVGPSPKQIQKVALGIGIAGGAVFGAIGLIAYPRLMSETRALAAARQRVEVEERMAAQTIAQMRAARSAGGQKVDPIQLKPPATPMVAEPAGNTPAASLRGSSKPAVAVATASATVAPTTASAGGDQAFRTWVTNLRIGGVRGGAVARILIGRSAYNAGDIVEPSLGIRFDGYNAETHTVRFRDDSGHSMDRRDW